MVEIESGRAKEGILSIVRSAPTSGAARVQCRPVLLALVAACTVLDVAESQDELRVWREFVSLLRSGTMTVDRIRPHQELADSRHILLGYLEIARQQALPEEWETDPEVIRRDSLLHYIISLTTDQQRVPYCLTFLTSEGQWYFRHIESIFIRLDTIATFPTSDFPDLDPGQKAWIREELFWSFVVLNVYLPARQDRGKEYALGRLKDGGGYYVAAKAWVPFDQPHRAFILYLCWEQSRLRSNDVLLVSLSDTAAIVEIQSQFFALYDVAAHLKGVISASDYREIFETIWQDRARKAGWSLQITYHSNHLAKLHFRRAG